MAFAVTKKWLVIAQKAWQSVIRSSMMKRSLMDEQTKPHQPVLETIELSRLFGSLKAVDDVSLTVDEGEIFGLLGPNGAGKTTLLKMLTTLLPPSSGQAVISGVDVRKNPAAVRHLIGYVPQLISADGSLTGYENLWLFAKLYDLPATVRKQRVQEALELMGLTDSADRYVKEYSGGMIRRLEIVQAMLNRPTVLFLDEPTSGLDPVARQVVWHHLKQAHQNYNMTIVLTTHDMEEADLLCDRIAIMNHGAVAVTGSPASLKATLGPNATLADVFIHYTGDQLEANSREDYYEIKRQRKDAWKRG
jgi:ABC-2 type transport system ATP-binding protein